jgi:type I restriction enzyme S subunit
MYVLKAQIAQDQFKRLEVGAMVTGVNIGDLKAVRVPVPPRSEHDRIVASLDDAYEKTEATKTKLLEQIALLREHRRALITATTSGDVKIPGIAA